MTKCKSDFWELFSQKADFSGKKRTNLGAFFKRSAIRPRSDKADLLGSTGYGTIGRDGNGTWHSDGRWEEGMEQ